MRSGPISRVSGRGTHRKRKDIYSGPEDEGEAEETEMTSEAADKVVDDTANYLGLNGYASTDSESEIQPSRPSQKMRAATPSNTVDAPVTPLRTERRIRVV